MSELSDFQPRNIDSKDLHKRGPGLVSTFVFTNFTSDYDQHINPRYYELFARLMGRARLGEYIAETLHTYLPAENSQKKVLDIGAGTGLISEQLYRKGLKVTAADLSEKALTYLRTKRPYVDAVKLNMNQSLPFSDESFDGITTVASNRYMTDTDELLRETFRVLKPGGVFLWPVFVSESLTSLKNLSMLKKFNPEKLRQQALQAGYKDVKIFKPSLVEMFKTMAKKFLKPEYIPVFVVAIK